MIEHFLKLRTFVLAFVLIKHLLNLMLAHQALVHQRLQERAPQRVERRVLSRGLAAPVVVVVIPGIEQRIRQTFHQVAEIDPVDVEAIEF